MSKQKDSGQILSVVAYLTLIGVIIAYFMNKDKKSSLVLFHVRQSLGLWLVYFIIGYLVSGFDNIMISYAFWIFFSVLFIYGIFGAISGKASKIPLLGDVFQNIFKSIN